MSEIVPFPAVRRLGYVRNMARCLASYSIKGAERTLAAQLNAQRTAMLRKGVQREVVAREIRSLELAIRTALWTVVMRGDDVA
jgi:hypothetical protein